MTVVVTTGGSLTALSVRPLVATAEGSVPSSTWTLTVRVAGAGSSLVLS